MDIKIINEQISRLKYLLSLPDNDFCWQSKYNNSNEAINDLEQLEKRIINNDKNAVKEFLYLFAPTAALQEISISSGWGDEFLDIAEILENFSANNGGLKEMYSGLKSFM